mmetsp:Transcript_16994/g.39949  ORF Transcript_16994/g.39949 Transcript_16994/m.39949 type:complete len:271 (+) Transcript_16994:1225-2037(+)
MSTFWTSLTGGEQGYHWVEALRRPSIVQELQAVSSNGLEDQPLQGPVSRQFVLGNVKVERLLVEPIATEVILVCLLWGTWATVGSVHVARLGQLVVKRLPLQLLHHALEAASRRDLEVLGGCFPSHRLGLPAGDNELLEQSRPTGGLRQLVYFVWGSSTCSPNCHGKLVETPSIYVTADDLAEVALGCLDTEGARNRFPRSAVRGSALLPASGLEAPILLELVHLLLADAAQHEMRLDEVHALDNGTQNAAPAAQELRVAPHKLHIRALL